jgi:hypothetical protein
MKEVGAPDLYGLGPDEATRVCYGQDLWLTIKVADMVEVSGWDPSRVRVTRQWPSPGSRMDANAVVVWVDIIDGGEEAGVREPRRPSPPLLAPGGARDESALGSDGH